MRTAINPTWRERPTAGQASSTGAGLPTAAASPLSRVQCLQAIGDSLRLLAAVHLGFCLQFNRPRPRSR